MFETVFSGILFLGFFIHVIRSLISLNMAHDKLNKSNEFYKKEKRKLQIKYLKSVFKGMIVLAILFLIFGYINLNYLT